jgi:hypothetical protein
VRLALFADVTGDSTPHQFESVIPVRVVAGPVENRARADSSPRSDRRS